MKKSWLKRGILPALACGVMVVGGFATSAEAANVRILPVDIITQAESTDATPAAPNDKPFLGLYHSSTMNVYLDRHVS